MTNLKNKFLHILLLFVIITSCSQKKSATIVIRKNTIYDRYNSYNKNKYSNKSNRSNRSSNNGKSIVVAGGDTVYDIANANKVAIRDLINKNNLKPPYILRIGQRLYLPKGRYHQVVAGDNLYDISRTYNMNLNHLIAINHLDEPYTIKVGDKLKIAKSSSYNTKIASKSKKRNVAKVTASNLSNKNKTNRFIWPVKGKIISTFGQKSGGLYNDGINIKANKNDSVKVAQDGTVAYVGNELKGYGNLIIVKHSKNYISAYAHLGESRVKPGDKVIKGTVIATVGTTGNVDFPQLYFGIRRGRQAVDPKKYLS